VQFVKESVFPASVEKVFAFHERPEAFLLLQPPWDRVEVIRPPASLEVGTRVELRTRVGPKWVRIVAEHVAYEHNRLFEDVMREGPFAHWHHRHLFFELEEGCRLRDEIDYAPPLGWLGRLADPIAVRPRLQRLFDYRHELTLRELLAAKQSRATTP
jgi:ligand-binding SRPBCC domain-containing protein